MIVAVAMVRSRVGFFMNWTALFDWSDFCALLRRWENGSHGVVVDERIKENLRFKRRLQLIKHRLLGRIGRVYAISF